MGDPSISTVKRLFALSGNRCAFPDCENALVVEPSGTVTGKICHIRGNKFGSKRHDSAQSEAERQAFENLILLCGFHHDVIDGDESIYTIGHLIEMKRSHESSVATTAPISNRMARDALLLLAGAGTMATIGETAREIGELINAIVDVVRGPRSASKTGNERNRPAPSQSQDLNPSPTFQEILDALRYGPKGKVTYIMGGEPPGDVMLSLARIFEIGGWRNGGVIRGRDTPAFGLLLFSLVDRNQASNARQTIDFVLEKLGFAYKSTDGESYCDNGQNVFRFAVVISQ